MRLFPIEGNRQRLDGGAMFGNAPQGLWRRWCPPDERNRIDLAARALVVEEPGGRRVLFESGIGAFLEPGLADRYGVYEREHRLLRNLAARDLAPEDIDVVVLSHLHFDHAGGILAAWKEGQAPRLCFPRARYVVGHAAWDRASAPHPRDRASFIPQLPGLVEATGRLERVAGARSETLGDAYTLCTSDGHTPGMVLTRIQGESATVQVLADLAPGIQWLHLPITMGYDRFPERLVDEKRALFEEALEGNWWLFFTHDPTHALCRLTRDDKGRFSARDAMTDPGPEGLSI